MAKLLVEDREYRTTARVDGSRGRSDRSAQADRPTLRSIRPKRARRPFDASVDPTDARCAQLMGLELTTPSKKLAFS
jgi:hypothetical protein